MSMYKENDFDVDTMLSILCGARTYVSNKKFSQTFHNADGIHVQCFRTNFKSPHPFLPIMNGEVIEELFKEKTPNDVSDPLALAMLSKKSPTKSVVNCSNGVGYTKKDKIPSDVKAVPVLKKRSVRLNPIQKRKNRKEGYKKKMELLFQDLTRLTYCRSEVPCIVLRKVCTNIGLL